MFPLNCKDLLLWIDGDPATAVGDAVNSHACGSVVFGAKELDPVDLYMYGGRATVAVLQARWDHTNSSSICMAGPSPDSLFREYFPHSIPEEQRMIVALVFDG